MKSNLFNFTQAKEYLEKHGVHVLHGYASFELDYVVFQFQVVYLPNGVPEKRMDWVLAGTRGFRIDNVLLANEEWDPHDNVVVANLDKMIALMQEEYETRTL